MQVDGAEMYQRLISGQLFEMPAGLSTDRPATPAENVSATYPSSSYPSYGSYWATGQKWQYGMSRTGAAPLLDHATMRRNARAAFHESLAARAVVNREVDTVVDVGIRRECQPDETVLGISAEEAEVWSRDVESRFHLWASKKTCSRDERLTFYQLQRLAFLCRFRDGEWFARLFYNPRRDLSNSLQIQLLDPNQINGWGWTRTDTVNPLDNTDGIIRDADGREVGYSIFTRKPDGTFEVVEVPARGRRSGRRFMLHGFTPEYAGQGRGYSAIAHAVQDLENLTDFTSAQIKKAIIESSINLYVKPGPDNPSSMPFADQVSGPSSQFLPPVDPDTPVSTGTAGVDPLDYSSLNDVNLRPGSVGVFNLENGEDLKSFSPSSPSEQFSKFTEAFIGSLAASCGMPPELVTLKFGQNYSASRAAILLFWRQALRDRMQESADLYDPIFEIWLSNEIARGRIDAPGWSDPVIKSAWLAGTWDGPPVPDIDPLRAAKAAETYVTKLGAMDLDQVAKERNGTRGTSNRAKLAKQWEEFPLAPYIARANNEEETDEDGDDMPADEGDEDQATSGGAGAGDAGDPDEESEG